MTEPQHSTAPQRLEEFFGQVGGALGNDARRTAFAVYAHGLIGDGERKSVEPIAARACADPDKVDALHQRLLHFTSDANWSDAAVRLVASRYVIGEMTKQAGIQTWIIDDTGFLKQGDHSVGVQRQYTGSAGKVTNCQVGVSLSVATPTEHAPIDFELYLSKKWTDDPVRRAEARIPAEVKFRTKPELALDMIRRAIAVDVPKGVVLADAGYGTSRVFREELRALGLDYAVGVGPTTTVFVLDKPGAETAAISVRKLALEMRREGGFRRCTWRQGTRRKLSAKFARLRVLPAHSGGTKLEDREPLWLVIEWRDGEAEPANYFFTTLPEDMPIKAMVQIIMQRWRTERVYEDLKGELGLDHFEGRRYRGWHHHVSVALCCYAFIIGERIRLPPFAHRPRGSAQPRAAQPDPAGTSKTVSSQRASELPN